MNSKEGKLIVFEGPDGVGKSSIAAGLYKHFLSQSIDCSLMSFPGNEEGTVGKLIYSLHHNPIHFGLKSIQPVSLQMMHIAAHVDAIETRILPKLKSGQIIILDRFWWSTWVYGKIAAVNPLALNAMIEVEKVSWNVVKPAGVFLLARSSPLKESHDSGEWKHLVQTYKEIADIEKEYYPIHIIINELSIEETLEQIINITRRI
jgi:thymidylate kinase